MPSPASPRYAHVLLDFDRTLHDSDRAYERRLDGFLGLTGQQVFQHLRRLHEAILSKEPPERLNDADFQTRLLAEELARTNVEMAQRELRARFEAAWEDCRDAKELFEETIPFLARLTVAGYILHLATGDYARRKADGIERQAGRTFFRQVFDEEALGVGKGKRDYYDRALERLGAPSRQVVVVGDSLKNDIVPGKEAGLGTVWVRRKNEENKDGVAPDLVAASLTEALGYLVGP